MREAIFRGLQGLLWLILIFSLLVIGTNMAGMNYVRDASDTRLIRDAIGGATADVCATVAASALAVLWKPRS